MIVKDVFDLFTKEKLDTFFGYLKGVDEIHTARSLQRLIYCNPLNCDLAALPVEQLALDKGKHTKLLFVPQTTLREFEPNTQMEGLASVDFDRCVYMRAVFGVATFHPMVYKFESLDFSEILGAEFIGYPDKLPDVFLEELFSRIKNTRLRIENEPILFPPEVLAHYSQREQIDKIKNVFVHNKLQLYLTVKKAAETVKGSTD